MKNLAELLRSIEMIANHRYNGDAILSKESGEWKVEFRRKEGHSVARIESGGGKTLAEALDRAIQFEIEKVEDDFEAIKAIMKQIGKR